jgi:hypothetical protein
MTGEFVYLLGFLLRGIVDANIIKVGLDSDSESDIRIRKERKPKI